MNGLSWLRALLVLPALVLTLLAALAGPAAAHGRGSDATNMVARVTSTPQIPGVSWRVYGGDEFLSVTNTSDRDLFVLAYRSAGEDPGEPFLRIGPDGVFENRSSPYTYSIQDRYGATPQPPGADPDAEPQWVQISDGPTALWHDHRIHWMAPTVPPAVVDPDVETVIFPEWEVPFRIGDEVHIVTGDLRWVPGPSPWQWLLGGLFATLPALAGLRTRPVPGEHGDRWPGLVRPAALVLGVVAALNLTHLADDVFAVPLPLSTTLVAASQTLLFIAIAAFAARRAWQAGDGAFTALGVGAGALLVGQGLLYLPTLSVSQTASILPDPITRAVVALSVAQALPLLAVTVMGTRRLAPPLEPDDAQAQESARSGR